MTYAGAFLYEDEQGRYKNKIDVLWVRTHDQAQKTGSIFAALVNQVAALFDRLLERAFGNRLLSLRGVATSVCFGLAGMGYFVALRGLGMLDDPGPERLSLALATLCLAIGCLQFLSQSLWIKVLSLLPSGFLLLTSIAFFAGYFKLFPITKDNPPRLSEGFEPLELITFSVAFDAFCIAFIRAVFKIIGRTRDKWHTFLATFCLLITALAIVAIPYRFSLFNGMKTHSPLRAKVCNFLFLANLSSAALCLIFCLTLLIILIHQLFFPTVARIVYPLARFDILEKRRLLLSLGPSLIAFAVFGDKIPWEVVKDLFGK